MEKVNNKQQQVGNGSRERKILRNNQKGHTRAEMEEGNGTPAMLLSGKS